MLAMVTGIKASVLFCIQTLPFVESQLDDNVQEHLSFVIFKVRKDNHEKFSPVTLSIQGL